MSDLIRFGVSLPKELLEKFDSHIQQENYHTRSSAIADLIRSELIKKEWEENKDVAGVIVLVYDHHQRELLAKLTEIQHSFHGLIISSQHVHLDHDNCFEVIVVKGTAGKIRELSSLLKVEKGVKHTSISLATTGKDL